MLKHEKKAFWQFFSIYFGSVALLILASGYFYFGEQRKTLIEKEHFAMIDHIRQLKMKQHNPHTEGITHTITHKKIENFSINNLTIEDENFVMYLPYSWKGGYYKVKKSKSSFDHKLANIKSKIISVQLLLLILFAMLSYLLALRALRPMKEAISKLDNFSKDLIHDLNTPITSILLNMKILDAKSEFKNNKPLSRIKKSVEDIGELHSNLTLLLQEDSLVVKEEDILEIVKEAVEPYKKIYTNLNIEVEEFKLKSITHKDALKQVIANLVSNACKYNKKEGSIKIYLKERTLYIEDSGVGIKNPQSIFNRSYKEHESGHGIGLDIVKRLCDAMEMEIAVESKVGVGTTFTLACKY